jgi:sugar O-acyltransferase (sialic acid O-acetyltransferase NeuD family)
MRLTDERNSSLNSASVQQKPEVELKGLIIIGAGRFGREVCSWARQSREHNVSWFVKGFLDGRSQILDNYCYNVPILGSPEDYQPTPDDVFVCAIGEPRAKKIYSEMLLGRGAQFANLIHPTVIMGENVKMGCGVILCPYVVITCDVVIGDFVTVNVHSLLAHDVVIGNYCQIHPHVSVSGGVTLKDGVMVGSNAVILPDCVVEEFALVGAGSLVLRRVAAGQTVFGNPASPLGLPRAEKS